MTDSAISGPIPSPGKRVAVIVLFELLVEEEEEEEKKVRSNNSLAAELGFDIIISLARLRRRRRTIWEAIEDLQSKRRE